MKKYIIVCLVIGMMMTFGTIAMAGPQPGTGIQQSPHDLSTGGGTSMFYNGTGVTTDAMDRICIYCHTPHHAMTAATAATNSLTYFPLWNHDVTALTYQTYTNGEQPNGLQHLFNGAADIGQPGSVSRLCLSCHDGSVALSAYGQGNSQTLGLRAGAGGDVFGAGSRFLIGGTGDLSNHHPIGFNYRNVAALDDEIADPDATPVASLDPNMFIVDLLWADKMECSSCHDVHNTKNAGAKFTWVDDTRSVLCLTCHLK